MFLIDLCFLNNVLWYVVFKSIECNGVVNFCKKWLLNSRGFF